MFLIIVVSIFLNNVTRDNKARPLEDEVYDMMVQDSNLKLRRTSSSIERNAWRLLKKYKVSETTCPITGDFRKRVVSLF